jgi:hypothetical protein
MDTMPTGRPGQTSEQATRNVVGGVDRVAAAWYSVPVVHLCGGAPNRADVETAVAWHKASLAPGDGGRVEDSIRVLADRLGARLPPDKALRLDVEAMAAWPPDLFAAAFRAVWETWAEPSIPPVGVFRRHIEHELAERRALLARAHTLLCKLDALCRR